MKILGIAGTNAKKSHNRLLLETMAQRYAEQVDFDVVDLVAIPLFCVDHTCDRPQAVCDLIAKVESADAIVIATPEYDHAVPAVLKSALEWLSCGITPFKDKPVLVVGASLGAQGTVRAQMNLREILNSPGLYANIYYGPEFQLGFAKKQFDERGQLVDEKTLAFLDQTFDKFCHFARHNQVRENQYV